MTGETPETEDLSPKTSLMDYKALVDAIKMHRQAQGLTQMELATRTPISDRTLKRIEKGEKPVRPYHLEEVCRALGLKLQQKVMYTLESEDKGENR